MLADKTESMISEGLLHRQLSESIIGCAMKVLNALKPGFSEKAYENALAVELGRKGHQVERQKRFEVRYEGVVVDTLIPDLLIDNLVIADTKVVENFTPTHMAQMLGYLNVTRVELALLLNFKFADLRWQRVVNQGIHPRPSAKSAVS
ncbi:MAG: GxxExxY protein [Opitutus sp.]